MTELELLKVENERLKEILRQCNVERYAVPFICGKGGKEDSNGLPERLHVCPVYGADVGATALYERVELPWED